LNIKTNFWFENGIHCKNMSIGGKLTYERGEKMGMVDQE
jgi:hypothetical protein